MPELLFALLEELESIAEEHEEICGDDASEKIGDPIWSLFVSPVDMYELPDDFGLSNEDGNRRVKQALQTYINGANKIALYSSMSLDERLNAFQNMSVVTQAGGEVDDFFYWRDPSEFDPERLIPWSLSVEEKTLYCLCYQLLENLESISLNNPGIFNPACKEKMSDLVWDIFVLPNLESKLSDNFGLSSKTADREVKQVLQSYATESSQIASSLSLSFHQRLAIFQDKDYVTHPTEKSFDDFFNRRDPEGFDAAGKWVGVDKTNPVLDREEIIDN